MILNFPLPYDDELFYSVCARYGARTAYKDYATLCKELFGDYYYAEQVLLPTKLDYFLEQLSDNYPLTLRDLLDGHTLLPYFAPFISLQRLNLVQKYVRDKKKTPSTPLFSSSSVRSPQFLKYCAICVSEDKQRHGETYWRRSHQVPGVRVCLKHNTFLEVSEVSTKTGGRRHHFVPADEGVRAVKPVSAKDMATSEILMQLGQDVIWLLNQSPPALTKNRIVANYTYLLAKKGLSSHTGRTDWAALAEHFIDFYGEALLIELGAEIDKSSRSSWLRRITCLSEGDFHPLKHLLLMQSLSCSAEAFWVLETHPFGRGPWPCLNPVADHHMKPVVVHCDVAVDISHGKPGGTFYCSCGFIYYRRGPDRDTEDRVRYTRVRDYGPVWKQRLEQLWRKPDVTLGTMKDELGVHLQTLKRQAAGMGLTDRDGLRKAITREEATVAVPVSRLDTRDRHRSVLLAALGTNPDATRTQLNEMHSASFLWLRRNNKDWYDAHLPPRRKRGSHTETKSMINWAELDDRLVVKFEQAASRLYMVDGRPERVSRQAIFNFMGMPKLSRNLYRLPKTEALAQTLSESREQFAARRIYYWATVCREAGESPSKAKLTRMARVVKDLQHTPLVFEALDRSLTMLAKPYSD